MKKRYLGVLAAMSVFFLMAVETAGAVTVPDVPVSSYATSLLTAVANVITDILPYAAAITAFAIGVGMLKRWLGHRKASNI